MNPHLRRKTIIMIYKKTIAALIILPFFTAFFSQIYAQEQLDAMFNFERKLWSGEPISQSDFDQYQRFIRQQLAAEISRGQTQNVLKSLNYLEKLKTLQLIKLFYQTDLFQKIVPQYTDFLKTNWHYWQRYSQNIFTNLPHTPEEQRSAMRFFKASIDSARQLNPLLINCLIWQKPIELAPYKHLLSAREMVIDYWFHDNQLTAFAISRDSLQFASWQVDSAQFYLSIKSFTQQLFQQNDVLDLKFDIKTSQFLYSALFDPLERIIGERTRIIIIPDKPFISLPFECLSSDTVLSKSDEQHLYKEFSNLNFLIKKFAISYCYALSSLECELFPMRSQDKLGRRLLTMNEISFSAESDSLDKLVSPIMLLNRGNEVKDEIRHVSRLLFRHDNVKSFEATYDYLKQRADEYRWIHLAQLGILNGDDATQSALMISPDEMNSSHWLDIDQILSIPFRADMVTLSGTAILSQRNFNYDDAAIALPQSFLLAGNKSLVFSLWDGNSSMTSDFMSKFYWELKYKRQHNTLALRGAKLASLNNSFEYFDKKISAAHPYFWARFRLIGNPHVSSPSNAKIPPWGVVIIVYIVVFIISLIITRKTRPRA